MTRFGEDLVRRAQKDAALGWRVGRHLPINVYEGDRPVCQCHTAADARRIVRAMNEKLERSAARE